MQPPCQLMCRLVLAPQLLAWSAGAWCRASRGVLLLAVLAGQVGLPSSRVFAIMGTGCRNPQTAPDTACQCPPALRRLGRCCCAAKPSAAKSGCCTARSRTATPGTQAGCGVKPSAALDSFTRRNQDEPLAFRDGCPCGNGPEANVYRCADPRVMPSKPVVSLDDVPARLEDWFDETACGELLPPPLPPPKRVRG